MKACYFSEVVISDTDVKRNCITKKKPCNASDFEKCKLFQDLYRKSLNGR